MCKLCAESPEDQGCGQTRRSLLRQAQDCGALKLIEKVGDDAAVTKLEALDGSLRRL